MREFSRHTCQQEPLSNHVPLPPCPLSLPLAVCSLPFSTRQKRPIDQYAVSLQNEVREREERAREKKRETCEGAGGEGQVTCLAYHNMLVTSNAKASATAQRKHPSIPSLSVSPRPSTLTCLSPLSLPSDYLCHPTATDIETLRIAVSRSLRRRSHKGNGLSIKTLRAQS
jgi:hypothetical protein